MNRRSAEETKNVILAATRKVFAEQGYDQASMRTIAQEAGVSVGGLYLYFKSKDELYLTLTEEWMAELRAETVTALAGVDDPREALEAYLRISFQFAMRHRGTILLQGREMGHDFRSDRKKSFFHERRAFIVAIIDAGIEKGAFRPCDAEESAKVIFSILRGFFLSMLFEEEALFSPEACADMVLNGLVRRNVE